MSRLGIFVDRKTMSNAEQLTARTTLTGEPLPPLLPATAQAWHDGLLDQAKQHPCRDPDSGPGMRCPTRRERRQTLR